MRITVVGGGYVGLVTGACFSHLGNDVLVVEKVPEKVKMLKEGRSPIYEPGLEDLIREGLKRGNLGFTTDIGEGVAFSEVIFICVGTPSLPDGSADLSQVEEVARLTAKLMDSYRLLVEKSTVPVNTHQLVKKTVQRYLKRDVPFDVASNPEFLREGSAVLDFLNPDRIVVGVESERARRIMEEVYRPFTDRGVPLLITDPATAELIKHASNSFLAMKISFINMIADLCEKTGADVKLVTEGMGYDRRIGRDFLNAGIGYGGSCFPKDVRAFIRIAEEYGVDFSLLKEVERINSGRVERFMDKVRNALWTLKDKRVAVWGLSFKPNTDDIREAPSIKVVETLIREGARVRAYDPKAVSNFRVLFPPGDRISYPEDMYEAVKGAEALLILTEWEEFVKADMEKVKELMDLPVVVDGRNIFEPEEMKRMGFEYYSVGRS
ncbi:MAG: UDP-glucose/GDP-mannose dehydrogenase family protein [Aquificota bacterium]|nr:UDP-glucose/GDP-mannose dehydrogenase family protein [Aquificota bacterium]